MQEFNSQMVETLERDAHRTIQAKKRFSTVLLAGLFAVGGLTACEQKDAAEEGFAERAGRRIDRAAAGAADQINKAADVAGESIEKAGAKLENAAENAQHKNEQTQAAGEDASSKAAK